MKRPRPFGLVLVCAAAATVAQADGHPVWRWGGSRRASQSPSLRAASGLEGTAGVVFPQEQRNGESHAQSQGGLRGSTRGTLPGLARRLVAGTATPPPTEKDVNATTTAADYGNSTTTPAPTPAQTVVAMASASASASISTTHLSASSSASATFTTPHTTDEDGDTSDTTGVDQGKRLK